MSHDLQDEYIDVHETLLSYDEVFSFLERLEGNEDVKSYCNGSNRSGRWVFQIYNIEFIEELADVIYQSLESCEHTGPVLEVMSGDGRLTEFLQPLVHRQFVTTDAKDGRYRIAYPKWVESFDALESAAKYNPSIIILSWEPYLSMTGIEIVNLDVPTIWIGNPEMCGHPDLFDIPHLVLNSEFALSRHDSFLDRDFKSDVFLFNFDPAWLNQ